MAETKKLGRPPKPKEVKASTVMDAGTGKLSSVNRMKALL